LIDTVESQFAGDLMTQLYNVPKLDYVVSLHAEQDHSGSIPRVLSRYPDAKLITSPKAKGILMDLLHIPEETFITVSDGENLSLGDKTLEFIHTPWVHWPETMVAYLANALRLKAKFLSIIGSYGWGGKTVEILAGMIPNLKVEVIEPVLAKGLPSEANFKALENLAETIATKHKELGFE